MNDLVDIFGPGSSSSPPQTGAISLGSSIPNMAAFSSPAGANLAQSQGSGQNGAGMNALINAGGGPTPQPQGQAGSAGGTPMGSPYGRIMLPGRPTSGRTASPNLWQTLRMDSGGRLQRVRV